MPNRPSRFWLFKSEPETWSFEDQLAAPGRATWWDGVRNFQADAVMKEMRCGDRGFFYHSGKQKAIVGVVEVIGEHEPDPSDNTGRSRVGFGMVRIRALAPLPGSVSLKEIRANESLAGMALLRNSRLSVQPVTPAEWKTACGMGGVNSRTLVPATPRGQIR